MISAAQPDRCLWWCATIALCTVLLLPLTLVDVPPLLDYPNHLARMVVLAFGPGDPFLSRMYTIRWAIVPNLGIDLLLPPLLHLLPLHLAGRITLGIVVLLPVLGTIAYSRALFGVRSYWPLASGLVAYNATFLLGFLNFVAGIGIALLLAALWLVWREAHPVRSVILASLGAAALFFCHLMGVVLFFILIGMAELARVWQHGLGGTIGRLGSTLLPVAVGPLVLYAISPSEAAPAVWPSLSDKAFHLLLPIVNYRLDLDIATAFLLALFLLTCVVTRSWRIPTQSALSLVLLAFLYVASPSSYGGGFFIDTRFAIMLGFMLFAAILPQRLPPIFSVVAAGLFSALLMARMASLADAWAVHRKDLVDLRSVIATVEPGSRVFVASVSPEEAPDYWRNGPISRRLSTGQRLDLHLPALLPVERQAFWPFLFDNSSQQPVRTLSPYRELADRAGSVVNHGALTMPGKVDLCGYDYLLLLEAGGEPDLPRFAVDRLALHARSDIAALFRVRPGACAS